MRVLDRIKEWSDSRGISQQEVSQNDWALVEQSLQMTYNYLNFNGVSGYVLHKLEELIEYCEAQSKGDENGIVDAIADSTIFDTTEMVKSGYNIELVLNEVLNVIESRTGKWDDNIQKFVKDKSPEARARWYEPDYVKNCKEPVNKTPSLLDTHYHQGGECQYCGCYFNSLMKLAEHQDTCDKRNDFE